MKGIVGWQGIICAEVWLEAVVVVVGSVYSKPSCGNRPETEVGNRDVPLRPDTLTTFRRAPRLFGFGVGRNC